MQIRITGRGFEIVPTPDRQLVRQFVDSETRYLVVCEMRTDDPADLDYYYTLIEPQTGAVISPAQRSAELEGWEKVVTDEAHGLRLRVTRTVNPSTGLEKLHQTLTDLSTHQVVATREAVAFDPAPRETLLDSYLEQRRQPGASAVFLTEAYLQAPLAERSAFWFNNFLQAMRSQGAAGYDEYAYFTPENYAEWRTYEPEIDAVLEFFIDHFPDVNNEEVRAEIYRRLGKGS
jgi:hypothetical protein